MTVFVNFSVSFHFKNPQYGEDFMLCKKRINKCCLFAC